MWSFHSFNGQGVTDSTSKTALSEAVVAFPQLPALHASRFTSPCAVLSTHH